MGFWRLLPAGLGVAVPTMMQVGPDDAILNFCKWPRKIVALPENCLPGTSASEIYLLAALLVFISLLWFGRPYFKGTTGRVRMLVGVLILCCGIGIGILGLSIIAGGGDPGPAPHRPQPLAWVFSGMAGKSDADGFRVSDIQFLTKNTTGKSIHLIEAYIQSGIDGGKRRPLYLNTHEHGLISVHQANQIPADTDNITLIAKFPDLSEGDFMKDWGIINFVIKDDEQTFSGKIEERQLREIFDGYRAKAPPPRVTKKIETTASDPRPATIDLDDNVDITIDGLKSSGTGTVIKGRGNAKGSFKDISSTFADAKFPLVPLSENQKAIPSEKIKELLAEFSKELAAFEAERDVYADEVKRNLWNEEFKSVYLPRARILQSLIVFRIGIEPAIQDADANDMRGTMLILSVRHGRSSLGHDKPIGLQPATNVINYLRYLAERMPP